MAKTKPAALDRRLHVMLTAGQWKKLLAMAAAQGLTPSAHLRQYIETAVVK